MKPGRNDPCPCGSGRKYKQCCASTSAPLAPARSLHARGFDILEAIRYVPGFDMRVAIQTAIGHQEGGSLEFAEQIYRRILLVQPDNSTALGLLGTMALKAGKSEDAVAMIKRAITLDPNAAGNHNNYAEACRMLGRLDEAVEHCNKALVLGGDSAEVRCSLGNALVGQLKLSEAMAQFETAIALKPDHALAHWSYSLALLLSGDYSRGWREHEWRWQWKEFPSPKRSFSKPQWDGSDISGQRILLHAEQGFGDALQFVRYAALVAELGARVVVECKSPLKRLIETMDAVDEVVERGAPLPSHDVHCPLSSLPLRFNTTVETIPARIPYLRAGEAAVKTWQARLQSQSEDFKVGLAWSGSPTHLNDRNRSCSLLAFSNLAEIPGTRLYSLQKGNAAAQAGNLPGSGLIDLTDEINDFSDTAAFIENLDLVISVDTAVAHLAGALGKPVWLLVPFSPDWRWLLDRSDSPWYPSMRLFRQSARGEWQPTMEQVASELRDLVNRRGSNAR